MAITELVTGGFGDLGQAAGAGLNEYTTQMDYDKLAGEVDALFRQGASPQQASQILTQKYPQLGGGQPGGAGGMGQPPRPNVPGMNQPNVVPQMIGPSSQMQTPGGGYGTLGSPQQAPQQSAPPQQPPQDPRLASRPSGNRILGSPLELNDVAPDAPTPYPETAPRPAQPQNRMQQTSGAPSQAPQQGAGGMGGLITPRNMPLAQMIFQQRQKDASSEARLQGIERQLAGRQAVEGMKEEGRNSRAVFNAGARAALKEADLGAAIQTAQLRNDTQVLAILSGLKAAMARVGESAADRAQRGEQFDDRMEKDDQVLKVLTQTLGNGLDSYSRLPDDVAKEQLGQASAAYIEYMKTKGVSITPSSKKTEQVPGQFFGTNEKTTKTPPAAAVKPPTGPQPEKVVKRTGTDKNTGKRITEYTDGTRKEE
jgi:hypothetical protein